MKDEPELLIIEDETLEKSPKTAQNLGPTLGPEIIMEKKLA